MTEAESLLQYLLTLTEKAYSFGEGPTFLAHCKDGLFNWGEWGKKRHARIYVQ